MDKKDNIKELFNNRFSEFEADVDSHVWDNIQSELTNTGGAPNLGVEKSVFSNATVWVAAISVSAILGIGYFMLDSTKSEDNFNSNNTEELVKSRENVTTKEPKTDSIEEKETGGDALVQNSNKQNVEDAVADPKLATKNTESPNVELNSVVENEEVESSKQSSKTKVKTTSKKIVESNRNSGRVAMNAATPNKIEIAAQSSVLAMPMGGMAPLDVEFSTLAENPVRIKWDFDDGNKSEEVSPNHMYETPGIYFVTMIAELESGEIVMDKAVVEVKPRAVKSDETPTQSEIRVGNVFTPNGDGDHDEFVIICKGMQSFSMSIYSVNGHLVFQTEDPLNYWDGTDTNGDKVVAGTYYYLINAIGEDQKIYAPKGYINVFK